LLPKPQNPKNMYNKLIKRNKMESFKLPVDDEILDFYEEQKAQENNNSLHLSTESVEVDVKVTPNKWLSNKSELQLIP